MLIVAVTFAVLIDYFLGELPRFHPLVGFGQLASYVERKLNLAKANFVIKRLLGILGWAIVVLPIVWCVWLAFNWIESTFTPIIVAILSAFTLYLTIAWKSLFEHAINIANPLRSGNINQARKAVSMIVSRDTTTLDETGVAKATTESILENGADAIFSALFWFVVAGPVGAVAYRLINTLDAMWGYRTPRYRHFGWFAARSDDLVNFIPACLTALTYAVAGQTKVALNCWKNQGFRWKSPNAGSVMAAGAGAIGASLGGNAVYHGKLQVRPVLGLVDSELTRPTVQTIERANALVGRSLALWLIAIGVLDVSIKVLQL